MGAGAARDGVGRQVSSDIGRAFKDRPTREGRSLEEIYGFLARDSLVAYGWAPPAHLSAAPSNQKVLAALFRAWMDAGAHCPKG